MHFLNHSEYVNAHGVSWAIRSNMQLLWPLTQGRSVRGWRLGALDPNNFDFVCFFYVFMALFGKICPEKSICPPNI